MNRTAASRTGWTGWALLAALASALPVHAARDSVYLAERRELEAARYLFEIEGDTGAARALLERLAGSRNEGIRTQALYLRAGFLEEQGDARGAARLFREALDSDGLEPAQKQRVIARLLALSPESVRPLRDAGRMRGLPARIFAFEGPGGTEYVLLEDAGDGARGARLLHQDARGGLRPLGPPPSVDEDVLDATPHRVLLRAGNRQRVIVRRPPAFTAEVLAERFAADAGALIHGDGNEALLIGAQELRHVRGGQVLFTHPLPGPGCEWHPSTPRGRQGVVFCPGNGLLRVDLARRVVGPIPLAGDTPSEVLLSGEYLALRHLDHLEIRRGPSFDAFVWGFPSGLQDPVALGRSHVFIGSDNGPLRAFALRTGQLDWQRDDGAARLAAHGGELFVLTHGRVLLAVNERGRQLYAYEPGWDGEEPELLPGREWLVVHASDGARVRLNRELLRLTGGGRDHLLRAEREHLRRGDTAAALRELDAVLALEPGNGTAWREKARLLARTGAPRPDLARAWTQAARSRSAPAWSADPAFTGLATALGAAWVWKRQPGPRFFPVLTGGRTHSFYVENDNQTVVVLENRTGALRGSIRIPEPLDLKVAAWIGDTLAVSSPGRLYFVTPAQGLVLTAQLPLRSPVCHALVLPQGLLLSDWNGGVQLLDPSTRETVWEQRVGRGGTLLAHGGLPDQIDAFEIDGGWNRLRLEDGVLLASARMPPGTITEVHAGRDFAHAGYNEGLVVGVDRDAASVAWQRDMGEQIFSLSGRGDAFVLVGTASRRLVNLHGRTGMVQAVANVPTHLFNRPLVTADGYWVGTTEPALERRSVTHEVLFRYPLPGMPGSPSAAGTGISVSTYDNFILVFPPR